MSTATQPDGSGQGTASERFERLSAGLAEGVRRTDELLGLVLLGSASDTAASRRDEWSDHDFFALIEPGQGPGFRPRLDWLPDQERIVLTAREGEIGFVAVYDDGHVFEFALAEASELGGAVSNDATVAVDDAAGSTATLIVQARGRAAAQDHFDPVNDARLVLVKLLLGIGRVRRGEVLNGGQFVRIWAVQHLVRALRGRFADASTQLRDNVDPVRRFERDFPEHGERIAALLDQPVEQAAEGLYRFLREVLEPDWPEFPSRAADVVARRLGWPRSSVN